MAAIIDPEFDKIPADVLTPEEREARSHQKPARGLSINDTIAHDANLSVGSGGVDTSGVSAGEGETDFFTSDTSDSPEPAPVKPTRGSGVLPSK